MSGPKKFSLKIHAEHERALERARRGLARYQTIVDDLDALVAASVRPLPRAVWINPLVTQPQRYAEALLAHCPEAQPLDDLEHAWRLPAKTPIGRWPEFLLGALHAQEEATIWPADLLGAQPGECVLDLCAAPGNKTVRIAAAMSNRGLLVANEKSWARLSALRFNLERLGIVNTVVTVGDGCELDEAWGPFDRALVDAPCSCEGTGRKRSGLIRETSTHERSSMTSLQVGLLRRALSLTKPGGSVVYATCTYAPEENEGVLSRIAQEDAEVLPLDIPPHVRAVPGVLEFEGTRYRDDVVNAARIWAHHNDTGGFFVAKLRRL